MTDKEKMIKALELVRQAQKICETIEDETDREYILFNIDSNPLENAITQIEIEEMVNG